MLLPKNHTTENAKENFSPSQGPSPDSGHDRVIDLLFNDKGGKAPWEDWLKFLTGPPVLEKGDINLPQSINPDLSLSTNSEPSNDKLVGLLIEDERLNGLSVNTEWFDFFPAPPIEQKTDLSPEQEKRFDEDYKELLDLFGKPNSATGGQLRQPTNQGSTENSRSCQRDPRLGLRQGRITKVRGV